MSIQNYFTSVTVSVEGGGQIQFYSCVTTGFYWTQFDKVLCQLRYAGGYVAIVGQHSIFILQYKPTTVTHTYALYLYYIVCVCLCVCMVWCIDGILQYRSDSAVYLHTYLTFVCSRRHFMFVWVISIIRLVCTLLSCPYLAVSLIIVKSR